ncbi:MAG: MotA/TolQ/ExbB proton channel family protein [Nitrospirae bacterium]|nr:MotA/TolQ/ExbB proton channel family protein [Nitrospirota bacterium]
MASFLSFFQSGGVFMYFILFVLALGAAIIIERWLVIAGSRVNGPALWDEVGDHLRQGRVTEAAAACERGCTPLHQVLHAGVDALASAKDREDIENAVEEKMMAIMPRLESRLHYLPTLANVATLLGLLGTIMGLIEAFTSVAVADPSQKAALLSKGISLAMNTTAFGLIVAIPLMLLYSALHARTNSLIDTLDQFAFKLINLISSLDRRGTP